MKYSILYLLLFCIVSSNNLNASSPKTQSQATAKADDDKDGQVVAQSMGTMIQALGTFSQNPNNPVVAGACALQALGAFIKILIQVFDDSPSTRNLRTQEEIEHWFLNLPKEKQTQIMQIMIIYAHVHKANHKILAL